MDLTSYVAIILISAAALIYWYFKISFSYWKSRNVPHPEPVFPYGSIKGLGSTIQPGVLIQNIYKQFKGVDRFCGIYFFVQPMALLLDLDLVKSVMVKDFSNFAEKGLYYNEKVRKEFFFQR